MKMDCKGGCGKQIETRDNKTGTCRACKAKTRTSAAAAAGIETVNPAEFTGMVADDAATTATTEADKETVMRVKRAAGKGRRTARPAPKKAGRQPRAAHRYAVAAKRPADGEFKAGTQRARIYELVAKAGDEGLTAEEVLRKLEGKVESKGDLAANVRWYLTALRRDGLVTRSRRPVATA